MSLENREGNLNIRRFFENEYRIFKYFGMWIDVGDVPPRNRFKIYCLIINIPLMLFFNLCQMINMLQQMNDVKMFAACGYVVAISCMGSVKSFLLFTHRKQLSLLVSNLDNFQLRSAKHDTMARKSLLFYDKTKKILTSLCSFTCTGAMMTPLFYKKNKQDLPFMAWYPFNVSRSPLYELTYSHQCIAVFYVTIVNVLVDIIMIGLTTLIGMQCDILCDEIENMNDATDVGRHRLLKNCIQHHKDILSFAKITEKLFNEIYLGQFMACTAALCMTLFLLTLQKEPTFESFFLVFYQCSIFNLLLIPCWFSSEMQRKSENIPTAAYSCQWTDASKSFKKDLIFLIQKSQKPIKVHAIGLFQISVETFMTIVRSSFSYYTVLNNMVAKYE